jgi:glycosyltransferase involved in cell wall biosynthesis
VIHEAATAGLPIICSSSCGAAARLVLDGYNGAVVPAGNPEALARAMTHVSTMEAAKRAEMGLRGRALAGQLTPRRWAEYLLERVPQLRADVGLGAAP